LSCRVLLLLGEIIAQADIEVNALISFPSTD